MDEYKSVIRGFEPGDDVGGRIGIELTGEKDVIDNDVGVKSVREVFDAAIKVEIEPVAEAKDRVRRVLMNKFEHPAAFIEFSGEVLADEQRLRNGASGLIGSEIDHARADDANPHPASTEARRAQLIHMQGGVGLTRHRGS